jgi:hypothetical protein
MGKMREVNDAPAVVEAEERQGGVGEPDRVGVVDGVESADGMDDVDDEDAVDESRVGTTPSMMSCACNTSSR